MKSQTRALVRHISPFGNPIKEDNPFSLPPQQFFASSPSSCRNLIFRKKNRSSTIYPSCRSASDDGRRDFENVESTARSPHFLFFDPPVDVIVLVVYSTLVSFRSFASLPSWFSANNFDFRARHCTSLSSPDDISQST